MPFPLPISPLIPHLRHRSSIHTLTLGTSPSQVPAPALTHEQQVQMGAPGLLCLQIPIFHFVGFGVVVFLNSQPRQLNSLVCVLKARLGCCCHRAWGKGFPDGFKRRKKRDFGRNCTWSSRIPVNPGCAHPGAAQGCDSLHQGQSQGAKPGLQPSPTRERALWPPIPAALPPSPSSPASSAALRLFFLF